MIIVLLLRTVSLSEGNVLSFPISLDIILVHAKIMYNPMGLQTRWAKQNELHLIHNGIYNHT